MSKYFPNIFLVLRFDESSLLAWLPRRLNLQSSSTSPHCVHACVCVCVCVCVCEYACAREREGEKEKGQV